MLKEVIISLRPKQWYKNFVVFICIIFSLNLFSTALLWTSIMAFVSFCGLSSSVYLINDILDIKSDRKHPRKKTRPIALGKLKRNHALYISLISWLLAMIIAYNINIPFTLLALTYFIIVFFYSVSLKNLVIIDMLTISVGFVIRAIAGCLAIGVMISPWLILCTFFVALFLALGKRRAEINVLGLGARLHRRTLSKYTKDIIDQMTQMTTSVLILSYSLYTFLSGNLYMMATIPFMVYVLFRYLFLMHKKNVGEETEVIFKDIPIMTSMFFWVLLVICILYRPEIIDHIVLLFS